LEEKADILIGTGKGIGIGSGNGTRTGYGTINVLGGTSPKNEFRGH